MSLLGRYVSTLGITLNGNDVSFWEDQSGNGNHLEQTNATNQPEFVSNAFNGIPGLRFTGSEFLEALNNTMLDSIGAPTFSNLTFVVVHKPVAGKTLRVCGKGIPSFPNKHYVHSIINSGSNDMFLGQASDGIVIRNQQSDAGLFDGTRISIYSFNKVTLINQFVDGVAHNDIPGGSGNVTDMVNTQKFQVGDSGGEATQRYEGDLFEIQMHDSIEDQLDKFNELDPTYNPVPVTSAISSLFKDVSLYKD